MILLPEHIAVILEKHFRSEQQDEDVKVLNEWRLENPAHEQLYQQLVKLWQETGVMLETPVYDTEKAWDKLDRRLKPVKPIRNLRIYLLAACLIGVLVLAGRFFLLGDKQTIVAADNRKISLPDGSTVILRKGAVITFPASFNRTVTLEGEAFFDVLPDPDRPFRIETSRAKLQVLGTSFTINTNTTYDRLTVATGQVAFISGTEQHVISAMQTAMLDKKGFDIDTIKDANYLSWETGVISFDNTPISQVAAALSDHYNLFVKPDAGIGNVTITAKFEQQPVEQVLEEIALLVHISYRQDHDTIILFKP